MQSVHIPLDKVNHWFVNLYAQDGTIDFMRAALKMRALDGLAQFGFHSWCLRRTSEFDALVSLAFKRDERITDEDIVMLILTIEP